MYIWYHTIALSSTLEYYKLDQCLCIYFGTLDLYMKKISTGRVSTDSQSARHKAMRDYAESIYVRSNNQHQCIQPTRRLVHVQALSEFVHQDSLVQLPDDVRTDGWTDVCSVCSCSL